MTTPAGHANRVFEKSTSTGTGNLLLNGAENGFYSFFAGFGTGVTLGYVAENPITGENEVGIGEVLDNGGGSYSLKRNSVETSSNGNALVNFAAGFKYCRATFLASEVAIIGAGSTGTGALVRQTSPTINTPTINTPTIVGSGGTLTLPAGPDTLVGRATTDTLTNKTLVAPALGAATATTLNKVTITAPATGSTLTIADGKTLTASNTLTLAGTDGSTLSIGTGGTLSALAYSASVDCSGSQVTGTLAAARMPALTGDVTNTVGTLATSISANAVTYAKMQQMGAASLLGNATGATANAAELTLGTSLAFSGSTLNTIQGLRTTDNPTFAALTATTLNKVTIIAPATGSTLTIADGSSLITSGANSITLTSSGATNVTLPTTGTLATLAGVETLTNKTLSGVTFTTPVLGVATATSINKVAITSPATSATLTLADGSTLATSGAFSTTLTATGATNVTLPTTGTLATLAGTETLTNKTLSGVTFTTPVLGVATATSINKVAITTPATGATLTLVDGSTLATSGAFSTTLTATGATNVTLPTTGTLATLAGAETLTNKSIAATQLTGTLAAARMPALTGDITTSAGAVATTLAANAVTYAKFQQVAASSLVGNATGTLANATGITLGTSLAFSGSTLNTIQGLRTTDSPTFTGASFTSATIAGPTITGGSASGQGGYFLWQRTGAVNPFFLGHRSAILGGTSGNAILYSSGDNIELAPAATSTVTLTPTTSTFITPILSTAAGAGSGYATGAGGIVSQVTSRTTGVTLSKPCGQITTNTTSLAAGATAKFTVTNTLVAAADTIVISIQSGTTTDATSARVQSVAAGSFTIVIANGDASTAETGAIVLNFAILKSVTA